MSKKKIVIIGAGFTGTMTAVNLLKVAPSPLQLELELIERRTSVARGLAYTAPSDRFKLNVKAAAMGAWSSKPRDFIEWLGAHGFAAQDDTFAPRSWYGEYLEALLREAAQTCAPHTCTTRHAEATAVDYDRNTDRFRVSLDTGETLDADAVVLALGNLPRESFDGNAIKGTFLDPYDPDSYADIASKKRMFVLGSSLTAVDCILESEGRGFKGSYHILSRHGRLPLAHEGATAAAPNVSELLSITNVRALTARVRSLAASCGSSQPVIDALRPHLQALWRGLPPRDKTRFLRHARPLWEVHRHRIPVEHAQVIHDLEAKGRLIVSAGRIRRAERRPDETAPLSITWQERGARDARTDDFDTAMICIGPEGNLEASPLPLARQLIKSGLVASGPLKLGAGIQAKQLPPGMDARLVLVGPLQREALWEITAVRELRDAAEQAAHRLCDILSTQP